MSIAFVSAAQARWVPSFVDNFNGDEINTAKWKTSKSNSASVNLGYFSPSAVAVADGKLQLRTNAAPLGGRPYTAGAITTQQIFSQLHGYFEIRAKMARGGGMWPAFWLLPVSNFWSSEIDIVEYAGGLPTLARYAYHYDFAHRPEFSSSYDTAEDLSQEFHNYAVRWRPGRLDYYFDGKRVHTVESDNIKDEAMYLILNLAVSSRQTEWGGPDQSTTFDERFEVDYVRVYRYDPDSSTGYAQIPEPSASIPDTANPTPYATTSVDVTLSDLNKSYEVLPAGVNHTVDARIAVKALAADSQGFVRVYLKPLEGYKNGRLTWGRPVAQTGKLNFSLEQVGDRVDIPVSFQLASTESGLYKVDVLASDAAGRLFNIGDLKRVQLLDEESAPLIFDAYAIDQRARYAGRKLQGGVDFQILEAIGLSQLEIDYSLYAPDGETPIKSWSRVTNFHNLEKITSDISVMAPKSVVLTPDHFLRISVSDSFGQFTPVDIKVPLAHQGTAGGRHVETQAKLIDGQLLVQTELTMPAGENVDALSYVYMLKDKYTGNILREVSGDAKDFVALDNGGYSYSAVLDAGALQPGDYDLTVEVRASEQGSENRLFLDTVSIAAPGESLGTYAYLQNVGGSWSTNFYYPSAPNAQQFYVVHKVFDHNNKLINRIQKPVSDFTEVRPGQLVNVSFNDPALSLPAGTYRVVTMVFADKFEAANRVLYESAMVGIE